MWWVVRHAEVAPHWVEIGLGEEMRGEERVTDVLVCTSEIVNKDGR